MLHTVLSDLMERSIVFFPKLLAGIVLLFLGWFLAWLTKRLVIRVCVIFRLEHFLGLSRWKSAFEKADVRHGFYNFLGNIFFIVIFLTFLDFALITWQLKYFSDILGNAILFFPKLASTMLIFGIGWLISRWSAIALNKAMSVESIPYASVMADYAKIMLIVFFAAMALAQLDIDRGILLIGFATIFITLGLIAVITVAYIGTRFTKKENIESESNSEPLEDQSVKSE